MFNYFLQHWHTLLISVAFLAGAILVAIIAHTIVFWVLRRIARRKTAVLGQSLVRHSQGPARWIFPLLAVLVILPGLPLTPKVMDALQHIAGIGLIAVTAWLVILCVDIFVDIVTGRYSLDVSDNLTARRIQTQFTMLHRIVVVLVIIVTLAIMLMTFPAIKHIGESVLASAGLASLIVGLAMKGTLSNLIAGVQIAFTQPFRLEDAVVIEGEWGWIEEIGTMYVVVRLWDLRRLVLPLSYFLDHPFQNWTYKSANLLAHCYIYTDYSVPVQALRDELDNILKSTPLWGGKVCVLQVSQLEQFTVQIRALMDAGSGGQAWDLRCLVRERMIEFLTKNYPGSLPRYRGEFQTDGKTARTLEGQPEVTTDPRIPEPKRIPEPDAGPKAGTNHDDQGAPVRTQPEELNKAT
ncbi:MAG: mechanosensitive ion channel family protein [Acidobacteriaceae bacterium]